MTAEAFALSVRPLPSRDILGASVASLDWDDSIGLLRYLLAGKHFTKVSFLNANNANIAFRDPEFALALDDFLVLPDGVGVDIAAKMLYGVPFPANLNGTDFVPRFFTTVQNPLIVGLLGTRKENAEAAVAKLTALAPQHRFVFIHDGFFTHDEEPAVLERIRSLDLDVLLVAMGVPRQEMWIANNITQHHCTMPIAVGALLDFLSGAFPRAPAWVRRLRMEWIFRLALEPRRLWRRYVVGNPVFLARVLAQKIARRRV